MKGLSLLMIFWILYSNASAQTLQEWTKQDATQIEYLMQQIAALKIYTSYLSKGYEITSRGIDIVAKIKNGDLTIHRDLFQSYSEIKNEIKNSHRVSDIVIFSWKTIQQTASVLTASIESKQFANSEVAYIKSTKELLFADVLNNLDMLFHLIQTDLFQMNDKERLNHLESLYDRVLNNYTFSKSFAAEVSMLAVQRKRELNEVQRFKILHELN